MVNKIGLDKANFQEWELFQKANNLTSEQVQKFIKYYELLIQWGQRVNLTRISGLVDVLNYHFADSLALAGALDLDKYSAIADVGSGGGFPGIPLKIKYSHLKVTLIEVVGKKVSFMRSVVEQLELEEVEVVQMDWRTFLRSYNEKIDLFLARASLQIPELLRVFKPSSIYQDSTLVYWASDKWQPTEAQKKYISKEFIYTVGNKKRKLVLFSRQ